MSEPERVPDDILRLFRNAVAAAARGDAVVSLKAVMEQVRAGSSGGNLPQALLETTLVREASLQGVAVLFDS